MTDSISMSAELETQKATQARRRQIILALLTVGVLALVWIVVRPGVFTVQPIGSIPEGITIIYHSRNPEVPFFSSPDGLCLQTQGGVSLLCRAAALGAVGETISERVIVRLPYSHWAYLQSTGGSEFVR